MDQAGIGDIAPSSGAGLNEPPLTMQDRGADLRRLMAEGMSVDDARRELGMNNQPPPPPVKAASLPGLALSGAQGMVSDAITGAGYWTGNQDIMDAADMVGEAIGPSAEQDAAAQQRMQDRADRADSGEINAAEHLAGDVADTVVQSSPYFVGGAVAGKVTQGAAGILAEAASPAVLNSALGKAALGVIEAIPGGRKLGLRNPATAKRLLKLAGFGGGAAAFGVAGYMQAGRDEVERQGGNPDDPETREAIKKQAYARGMLESVSLTGIFGKLGLVTPRVKNVFLAAVQKGGMGSFMEGAQEVADNLIEDAFLNPETVKRLQEGGAKEVLPWLIDTVGSREGALAFLSGGVVGGAAGAGEGGIHQKFINEKAANEVRVSAKVLEPLGMGAKELEELSKTPDGIVKLKEAVSQIGRIERTRSANLRKADEQDAEQETIQGLRDVINKQMDDRIDSVAQTLGAPKSLADVERERSAWEKERKRTATDRLGKMGITAGKDVTPDVAERSANAIEAADARVEQLKTRLEATANPERRVQAQRDLSDALAEQQKARLDGRMKVEGLTSAQALKATQQDLRQTETDKRRSAQSASRERAVERQTEVEMPETMQPAARVARAQEILAEDAAEARPDAGIDGRVKRLERQRRAATTPEDVDKLTNEIADLEARRGLPTPAVEAARRVLQAQGVAIPSGGEASRPAAQTAGSEGLQPTDAASGPVGAAAPAGPRNALDTSVLGKAEGAALRNAGNPDAEAALFSKALTDRRVTETADVKRASEAYQAERAAGNPPVAAAETALETVVATDREAGRQAMAAKIYKRVPSTDGFDVEGGNAYRNLGAEVETTKGLEGLEASMLDWSTQSGFEVGAHINEATGEVLGVGTNDMVNAIMPPQKGLNDRAITFTHTHTQNTPFSSADILASLQSGQRFRAILPDGSSITMRPLRRYNPNGFYKIFRAVREHLITTLPADMPFLERAMIRQETFLQAMEQAGAIEYETAFRGLSEKQKEYVNAAVDATSDTAATAFVRDGTPGREGVEEAGGAGPQAGERRAFDEEAGEVTGDDVDEDYDLEQSLLGFDDGRSSDRQKHPSFNEERVGELTDKIIADVLAPQKRRTTGAKMILEGVVTRDQVLAGVSEYLRGDGRKQMYTLIDVRRAMFPKEPITYDKIESFQDNRVGRMTRAGSKLWRIKPEYHPQFQVALDLERMINASGMGMIQRRENRYPLKNEKLMGMTFFLDVSPELRKFTDLIGPEGMRFDLPLSDPGDTHKIKRNPKSNRLSAEGIEAAKRTARYLQANRYKISKEKVYALVPDDLVSGKSLARDGIRDEHITRWDAMKPTLPPNYTKIWGDWPKEQKYFIRNYGWKIDEKRKEAEGRIRQLRLAYEDWAKRNGEDADTGWLYQIDDRGRIYADGSFHPQADGDIKALFSIDGKNLVDDMVTVDNSASGWQINALMAYDHVAAPLLNMGRGQATQAGYEKSDLYVNTLTSMRTRLLADAEAAIPGGLASREMKKAEARKAWARMFSDVVFPSSDPKSWLLDRKGIKPAIIAMNYGGLERNFLRVMTRTLSKDINRKLDLQAEVTGQPKMDMDGAWAYLTEVGMAGVRETAPHALALQEWTISNIKALSKALYDKYGADAPTIELTIGLDGKIVVDRRKKLDTETRIKQVSQGVESTNVIHIKVPTPEPDHDKVAKAVWANLVQSYDATILHRAVERYKQASDGAFVTTNHDSFTVPREQEATISSSVRESMRAIMEQVPVPEYLYQEISGMARSYGVDLGIKPFDKMGQYNYDDLMTSTPVFGEDATRVDASGKPYDFVPEYGELPEKGADLRRAVDEEVPEAGVGAAASETPPARAPVSRGQGGPLPTVRRAHDLFAAVQDAADPARTYIEAPELRESWASRIKRDMNTAGNDDTFLDKLGRRYERNVVSDQLGLKQIERKLGMTGALVHEGMSRMSQMLTNEQSRVQLAFFHAPPKWDAKAKVMRANNAVKPLVEIFKFNGEGDYTKFSQYAYARRDVGLIAKGKGPRIVDRLRTEWLGVNAEEKARYDAMLKDYRAFNGSMLNLMEDASLISADQKKALLEDEEYVPMFRVFDDAAEFGLDTYFGAQGLSHPDPGIKALVDKPLQIGETVYNKDGSVKASGGNFGDLISNIQRSTVAAIMASNQNLAHQRVYDFMTGSLAHEAGEIVQKTGVEAVTLKGTQPKTAQRAGETDAVMFYRNGKPVYWQMKGDKEMTGALYMALAGMKPPQIDGLDRFLQSFQDFQRLTITSTPGFALASIQRDIGQAYIQNGTRPLSVVKENVKGFAGAFGKETQEFIDLMMGAGVGAYQYQAEPDARAQDIRYLTGAAKGTFSDKARQALKAYERALGGTEIGVRKAVYETALAKGATEADALYEARNYIDYGRKGASRSLRRVMRLLLFVNPRIQGLYRIGEQTAGDSKAKALGIGKSLAVRGMIYLAVSLAVRTIIAGNDDDEDAYMNIPLEERSLAMHFPIPGTGRFFKWNHPFELGAMFGSVPVAMMEAMTGRANWGDAGRLVSHTVLETMSLNPVPEMIKPLVEVAINQSFFSGQPIEGMGLEALPKEYRADARTGGLAKALGSKALSPVELQHVVEGYLGPLGMYFYNLTEQQLANMGALEQKGLRKTGVFGGSPDAVRITSDFLVGRFFTKTTQERNTGAVRNFFDTSAKIRQATAYLNKLDRQQRFEEKAEFYRENRGTLLLKPFFNAAENDARKLRGEMSDLMGNPNVKDEVKEARLAVMQERLNRIYNTAVKRASRDNVEPSFARGLLGPLLRG